MKSLSAKSRITIGLACLVFSVLSLAMLIGLVPDRRSAVLEGRADLCESIAVASSDYVSTGEVARLEFYLQSVVSREEAIQSAGVRRADGQLLTTVGNHTELWGTKGSLRSTETHILVPIRSGEEAWGNVELRFQELGASGVDAWLESTWFQLIGFVTAACYLVFFMYLGKMLQHLDPSKSVPKRVRAALDSLAEGLLVIDRDDRIVLANEAFADWVNRASIKLVGVKASSLHWMHDDSTKFEGTLPWMEALELEMPQAGVMLGLKHSNDSPFRALMCNASPVLGHDGKYRGVMVSFDDVTQLEETKRNLDKAKQAAEDAQQLAENANQAKSDFLARMSHEIRTPMNAILGYTDVLRRGFDESIESRQKYLNTIHGSGEHLLTLINDILDLSKVESGQMELKLERCSPHELIMQVVTLLRSKADEQGISLEYRCDEPLPETILTDSVRLRQTIMNLAGNAIKFTEKGGVTVAARLSSRTPSEDGGKPQLVVDVIDTGIGIPEAALGTIFEPFAQADTSVTRKFGGTGLGLAISRQLAQAMGGDVEVTSVEGSGSTFTITVEIGSLAGVPMVDAEIALAAKQEATSQKSTVVQLPPARILVADDGESNRKLIELVLRRAGVEVVSVENGEQAVDQALNSEFDVILMDMQMPVMDGYTAATTLRQAGYGRPIIALTAHAMRGDEEKCRNAGCSDFLTKPVNIDVLLARLADLLGGHEGWQEASRQRDECEAIEDDLHELTDTMQNATQTALADELDGDGTAQADENEVIQCALPLDDPDFLEIATEFVVRLNGKLDEMQSALEAEDLTELASLAHWLKGSGGTAGFDVFTTLAGELEVAAKAGEKDRLKPLVDRVAAMLSRIQLPTSEAPNEAPANDEAGVILGNAAELESSMSEETTNSHKQEPLISSLPTDDAEFAEIVEEFIVRLKTKLSEMDAACAAEDFQEVACLAHWLKGSGGTAGFEAFTKPARDLEQHAKQRQSDLVVSVIKDLRKLADRIVISSTVLP